MLIQNSSDGKHLYQRVEGGKISFQIRRNGQKIVESLHTTNFAEAKIERAKRLVELSENPALQAKRHETVTVSELIDDYLEFLTRGKASAIYSIDKVLNNIREHPVYKGRLAASITSDDNLAYRKARKKIGRADATCNNELSYLRSAYIHATKQTPPKVLAVPYFPISKSDNARQGFINFDGYDKLRKELPVSLEPLFVLAYHSGCRKAKLLNLTWPQVDFSGKIVNFEHGTANKQTGVLPFYGNVEETLLKQKLIHDANYPDCQFVFFWHATDTTDNFVHLKPGAKIQGFRKLWKAAVKRAGYDGLLFHDLRRSAVRNMVQKLGISEAEAMEITGHKTRDMLQRYNIRTAETVMQTGAKLNARWNEIRSSC